MAFIIGGHPRSGTTILNRLCKAHPEISMTVEFGNYLGVGKPYDAYLQSIEQRWGNLRREINLNWTFFPMKHRGSRWIVRSQLEAIRWRYMFMLRRYRHGIVDVPAIESIMRHLIPPAPVIGDKLPNYVYALDELVKVPGLQIVIIYRDARDVTLSTLKIAQGRWKKHLPYFEHDVSSAGVIAKNWVDAIDSMERNAMHIHVIRYEELILEQDHVLDRLAEWLGVAPAGFDRSLVRFTSIGKHADGLTDDERSQVLEVAGPTMQRLGYTWEL